MEADGEAAGRPSANLEDRKMGSPPPCSSVGVDGSADEGEAVEEVINASGAGGYVELGSSAESTVQQLDSGGHLSAASAARNSRDSDGDGGKRSDDTKEEEEEQGGNRQPPPATAPPPAIAEDRPPAQRLAGPLGMAVATVFHEVLEHHHHRGGASSADALACLLGAALRETTAGVLGDDQAVFVGDFKASFSRTYNTIRSVRRAYSKIGGGRAGGRPPRQHSLPKTWRQSVGIPSELAAKKRRRSSAARPWPAAGEEAEEIAAYFSASCGDESLLSAFFSTDSEREGNSYFTCSNLEPEGDGSESPASRPTPDARDVRSGRRRGEEEDDSPADEMVSAANSGEWVMVSGEISSSAVTSGSQTSAPSVSFDAWTSAKREAESDSRSSVTEARTTTIASGAPTSNAGTEASCASSCDSWPTPPPQPKLNFLGSGKGDASELSERFLDSRSSQVANFRRRIEFGECGSPGSGPGLQEGNVRHMVVHGRPAGQMWVETSARVESAMVDSPSFSGYGVIGGREELFRRYVEAQEAQNQLRSMELEHGLERLSTKKQHLQLQLESNVLTRENIDLGRSKAEFREFELEDRRLAAAHQELSRKCADELVAGLCVMLLGLTCSAWKFSYARLSRMVAVCQVPVREPRRAGWLGGNWMAAGLDALSWQTRALTCEVMKAGRMTLGLVLIAFVTSSLLRRSVTSSSQTMPATIIMVVLAGVCGFAGKLSIDSLGGDGFLWVLLWELLCSLHAFATCCTPWLYKYLYGPSSKAYKAGNSLWLKLCSLGARIFFHWFLAFGLPIMAGLLPFASPSELRKAFWELREADASFSGPF